MEKPYPSISIIGSSTVTHEAGDSYNDNGATALDINNLSVEVAITGIVNESEVGTYTITYTCLLYTSDAADDMQ